MKLQKSGSHSHGDGFRSPRTVSPPARLQIDIIDTRSLAPADPAWSGQPEQPITLRYQEGKRLLKLRMLSRDGGGLESLPLSRPRRCGPEGCPL